MGRLQYGVVETMYCRLMGSVRLRGWKTLLSAWRLTYLYNTLKSKCFYVAPHPNSLALDGILRVVATNEGEHSIRSLA